MSNATSNADAGDNSSGEHKQVIAGECKPKVPRFTTAERFATWTECLGFESFDESNVVFGDEPAEEEVRHQSPTIGKGVETRSRSGSGNIKRKSTWLDMSNFPPLLSTLNVNGRPRFDFIKTTDNGRLQMTMVKSQYPVVVVLQTPAMHKDKQLKMLIIKTHDDSQDDDDDDDEMDGVDDQDHQGQKEEETLQQSNVCNRYC